MKTTIIKQSLLALILGVTVVQLAYADTDSPNDNWYQVEVIVFSHITATGVNAEQWPYLQAVRINPKAAIDLVNAPIPTVTASPALATDTGPINFQLLSKDQFKLKKEQAKLTKNTRYQVLLHLAWRQQFSPQQRFQPIHIYGGNAYDASGDVIATDPDGLMTYDSQPQWQIDGTVDIQRKRFFNVGVNLMFAEPINQLKSLSNNHYFDGLQQNLGYFRLAQTRRMRGNELDYLDHPLYGVLIEIFPLKK